MTRPTSTLILTIDGLGSRDLGSYGNTWIETPALDRLAARALLCEQCLADDLDPAVGLTRIAGLATGSASSAAESVLAGIRRAGVTTILFSDGPDAFSVDVAAALFDRRIALEPSAADRSAAAWDQTHCAGFFAQLLQQRRELPRPHVLWVHYGGLVTAWDAPYDWRQRLVEEDDPDPPTWVAPPHGAAVDRDPDEQLQRHQAFAAELMVLDACLDPLVDAWLDEADGRFALTSPRGYPLGEHGVVGYAAPIGYSERTSVPLLLARADEPIGWRSQRLIQPSALADWLRSVYLSGDAGAESTSWPDRQPAAAPVRVVCRWQGGAALRTADWLLVAGEDRRELYVKPDDRWEFNDVSSRCVDVVEALGAELAADSTHS